MVGLATVAHARFRLPKNDPATLSKTPRRARRTRADGSFETVVTQTGMLQLWRATRDGRRWKLAFNVRERVAA